MSDERTPQEVAQAAIAAAEKNGDKRKLLIHSNAPWAPTGYGNQVGIFAPKLADDYEVAVSAFYGLEGAPIRWRGVPVLPGLGGEFGNAYLLEHARNFFDDDPRAGLLLTLMDVWVLEAKIVAQMNAACWLPVDHDPVPPDVARFLAQSGAIPIAMSRFGQQQLEEFDPLYVPHGVDTSVYKPHNKAEAREQFGLPADAFIVGMVAANKGRPSRKGFQQALEAFRELRRKYDNAHLYLHTTMSGTWTQGEELGQMIASLQIPTESVLIANQYRLQFSPPSAQMMARLYSSFDVLLNPAMGEGFGIPLIEAQACGVPVIATDFSAMRETAGVGWRVGCAPFWTGQRSWQALPDVQEIAEALEAALTAPTKAVSERAVQARAHALQYDAEGVYRDHLLPALDEIHDRIGEAPALEAAA